MLLAAIGLVQPALAFDHAHTNFATFLDGAVEPTGVDYATLKGRSEMLTTYLGEVANASTTSMSKDQKLAFYVNAYNAYTINLILTENPKSIQDLDGGQVWKQRSFAVGRQKMSLNQIEHDTIRKLEDGRIHAVVNCASKGCPPLPAKPLTADGIQGQLDAAARTWVATNAYKMDGDTLQLSQIFKWYGEDFTGAGAGQTSDADKHAAGRTFLTKFGATLTDGKTEWMDYDWMLNSK